MASPVVHESSSDQAFTAARYSRIPSQITASVARRQRRRALLGNSLRNPHLSFQTVPLRRRVEGTVQLSNVACFHAHHLRGARYMRIPIQGEGAMPLIAITESKHIITAKYAFTSE